MFFTYNVAICSAIVNVPLHATNCLLNSKSSFSARNPTLNLSLQSILLFDGCLIHLTNFSRNAVHILLQFLAAALKLSLSISLGTPWAWSLLFAVASRDESTPTTELRSSTTGLMVSPAFFTALKSSCRSLALWEAATIIPTTALPVARTSAIL